MKPRSHHRLLLRGLLPAVLLLPAFAGYEVETLLLDRSRSYSRDRDWKPGRRIPLEVSGIAILPNGDPVVCIRKGDLYAVRNAYGPGEAAMFERVASGFHEPLGLLCESNWLYVVQRSEVTRLPVAGGEVRPEYHTHGTGWGLSGNYHEYAYGPVRDGRGRLWVTLNIGIGKDASPYADWRGWGGVIDARGDFRPLCAGMRSPAGLAANAAGDVFCVDHQGNWFGTCPLYHLREGAFYGHQDSLAGLALPGAPQLDLGSDHKKAAGQLFPEAARRIPALAPPAVWFPYEKTARGLTDICLDDTGGRFGPFGGQFLVGEFTQAAICRVALEQVGGQYQGAVFRFRDGFPSAVLRLAHGRDGSLFVGLSNRGWSSLGSAAYGLQRLRWDGETPFEILDMRATPTGFVLRFTQPLDPRTAMDPASCDMRVYTYRYHAAYGSPEMDTATLEVVPTKLSPDGRTLSFDVPGRKTMYVHELRLPGLRSRGGEPLLHPEAYYTLNNIPEPAATSRRARPRPPSAPPPRSSVAP